MELVSIIIPTHNRPAMLLEAVNSIKGQQYACWEIIVVDDGSQPAVELKALQELVGDSRVTLIRNDQPMGLAWVRNQGVQHAKGDLIGHLDDDDLLDPGALQKAIEVFETNDDVDILCLKVEGFGKNSDYLNRVQTEKAKQIIESAGLKVDGTSIVSFNSGLIESLLISVPQSFQNYVMTRKAWDKVSESRREVYALAAGNENGPQIQSMITGPLRDSEWSIYAATQCNIQLLNEPAYLVRCEGQSYVSKPEQREKQRLANLSIKNHLYFATKTLPMYSQWRKPVARSYADSLFNSAYHYYSTGEMDKVWDYLIQAVRIQLRWKHMRFFLKVCLRA